MVRGTHGESGEARDIAWGRGGGRGTNTFSWSINQLALLFVGKLTSNLGSLGTDRVLPAPFYLENLGLVEPAGLLLARYPTARESRAHPREGVRHRPRIREHVTAVTHPARGCGGNVNLSTNQRLEALPICRARSTQRLAGRSIRRSGVGFLRSVCLCVLA